MEKKTSRRRTNKEIIEMYEYQSIIPKVKIQSTPNKKNGIQKQLLPKINTKRPKKNLTRRSKNRSMKSWCTKAVKTKEAKKKLLTKKR